nr:arginine decarboxylase, pyruvoyl-dependent [Candidatus Sigynarchaeum springense]
MDNTNGLNAGFVPRHVFFTHGVGRDKNKLIAFEKALREARIQPFNLVTVSSILPPQAKEISIDEGLKYLKPGQIVFVVMSRNESNEFNRMVGAAIGCAKPADSSHYGYLSEHHSFGQPEKVSEEYAEDLAAVMLATTLGISDFDIEHDWDARKNAFIVKGKIVETKGISATAVVEKYEEWTCVIAAAVFTE